MSPEWGPWEWIILALACFRLQRIVTKDTWYPTQWFREKLVERRNRLEVELSQMEGATDKDRKKKRRQVTRWREYNELFTCPWCFGFWTTVVVFAEHYYLGWVPLWIHAIFAASTVVGILGTYDYRPEDHKE